MPDPTDTETLVEVLALAKRAREGANFYAYLGPASGALRVLADDLGTLAARIERARAGEGALREWIASRVEGAIRRHRDAGNREVVAALAPLPELIRRAALAATAGDQT